MRFFIVLLLGMALCALLPQNAAAQVTADEVQAAIDRGVAYLKREQNLDGSWSSWPNQPGGLTALCTLALINSGLPPDDPAVSQALKNLRTITPKQTYAVALQTLVFAEATPREDLLIIQRNATELIRNQIRNGPNAGGWSYPGSGGDNSNSQFAMLALQAAEDAGVRIEDQTWRMAAEYWRRGQDADGSWDYQVAGPGVGTGSMTCAGIASMVIANGRLAPADAQVVNGRLQCCGNQLVNDSVDRGLQWLARNFSIRSNPGARGTGNNWLYYLYALERVGRMTAQRYVGDHDWYREGADVLVRHQDRLSGFWKGEGIAEDNPQIATSFALLFLAKGRRPILVSKLVHQPLDDWNNHRSDLANLTAYVEQRWDQPLTWQVIRPDRATTEDLLQSPVLFFNGSRAPGFTDEEVTQLRAYVEQGGFIFAEACCEGDEFDRGFRDLMQRMFPESPLRPLPPEHPVWTAEEPVDPDFVRPLWGIELGCRTGVIYSPEDLSCYWEVSRGRGAAQLPANLRLEVAAANAIGINVLAYATGRELRYKNPFQQRRLLADDSSEIQRGQFTIAKLRHTGGWNVAPMALPNLQRQLAQELDIRTDSTVHEFPLTDPQLFEHHLIFMHGRNAFQFTDAERIALRTYIERGGTLIADSICSSDPFAKSFRAEMARVFPDQPLEQLPLTQPLFSDAHEGFDIRTVRRREPERGDGGALRQVVREVAPLIEGIELEGRWGVLFSPYDLSCALESGSAIECPGYIREDAARIAINLVLYSLYR